MKEGRGYTIFSWTVALGFVAFLLFLWRGEGPEPAPMPAPGSPAPARERVAPPQASPEEPLEPILELVRPPPDRVEVEGVALALLVDTSGSMRQQVRDGDGSQRPKIDIARRASKRALQKLKEFQDRNPERPLKVGLYEFSGNTCRAVLPLDKFRLQEALQAVDRMVPSQGTPIGEAMLTAKHDLDRSGLKVKHMLLLTDGENTTGTKPVRVARAIAALEPQDQAGIHFIAFHVEASRFSGIRDAGGTVLQATSAPELDQCMDYVLYQKVLLEKPEPSRRPAAPVPKGGQP